VGGRTALGRFVLPKRSEAEDMLRKPRNHRWGFTLLEVVVAIVIMGILMTGLASALVLATHAMPGGDDETDAVMNSAAALDQMVEELRDALWFMERSAVAVTFSVPDRDGNGLPERVRYAWSAVNGDPLTRAYNGGSALPVVPNVDKFNLEFDLTSITEEYPGPISAGTEQLLSDFSTGSEIWELQVDKDYPGAGQCFVPTLSEDAVAWQVTSVLFSTMQSAPVKEQTLAQLLRTGADGQPTADVIAEYVLSETELPTGSDWVEIPFGPVPQLAPDEGVCLVLLHMGGGPSLRYEYGQPGSGYIWKAAGNAWNYEAGYALRHRIRGFEIVQQPPQTAVRQYVTGVRIELHTGDMAASRMVSSAQTLNTPELLSGFWIADADSDPSLDHNGDGFDDWLARAESVALHQVLSDGGISAPGDSSVADRVLDSSPDNDFTSLVTVALSFRCTASDRTDAAFWINADFFEDAYAPILVFLSRPGDGTQTLRVTNRSDASTLVALCTVSGLPGSFVHLRMVIDPSLDTVAVWVGGEHVGTYVYNTISPAPDERFATILASSTDAEVEFVSIRVSE
jgi:prepilin-type N-terminal cleavage/methylation domain-containing protein